MDHCASGPLRLHSGVDPVTQLTLTRSPDPRLGKISGRIYLALGAAWLQALNLDRDAVLRRWPTTDRLVLDDPIDHDDLADVSVVAARLIDLAHASTETTAGGDGAVPVANELLQVAGEGDR